MKVLSSWLMGPRDCWAELTHDTLSLATKVLGPWLMGPWDCWAELTC